MLFIGLERVVLDLRARVLHEGEQRRHRGRYEVLHRAPRVRCRSHGLSLLYLWSGLQFTDLAVAFEQNAWKRCRSSLWVLLVGFGFMLFATVPLCSTDAYRCHRPVAGVLATASKAMGVLGLLRILLVVASPEATDGSAVWLVALGVLSVITMTWGNLAALGSTNPKRMLAYSSVAHAGYMLAAITAIGALNWEDGHVDLSNDAALVVVTALIFHLSVLVCSLALLGAVPAGI